ncbi:unnamed protein product, partial [Symbiodinium necroappetens]
MAAPVLGTSATSPSKTPRKGILQGQGKSRTRRNSVLLWQKGFAKVKNELE